MVRSIGGPRQLWGTAHGVLIYGGALLVLVAIAYWGGAAQIDLLFFVGVTVLSGLILGFGLLTWWLYRSSGAASATPVADARSVAIRHGVGLLALISGLLFVTGAAWDEAWHRLYGVGTAVDDFLWPPHKLIYGSLFLTALFALGGLGLMLRGAGTIRQRFRSEPLIGMLGLASAYLALSAPSDYLWHVIYGLDITGWSLPHIFITSGAAFVMLTTAALLLSPASTRGWHTIGRLRLQYLLAGLIMAASTLTLTQAATTEWDTITVINDPRFPATFWARPEWLYPVVVLSISIFFSSLALHLTQRAGFASIVMIGALGLRALFLWLTNVWSTDGNPPLTAHLLMVIPAVTLDIWYSARLRRADTNTTLVVGNVLAAGCFLLLGLWAISQLMIYPRINAGTVPAMVIAAVPLALWFGWVGARFGSWMRGLAAAPAEVAAVDRRVLWAGAGSLVMFAALTLMYILTAAPPRV